MSAFASEAVVKMTTKDESTFGRADVVDSERADVVESEKDGASVDEESETGTASREETHEESTNKRRRL